VAIVTLDSRVRTQQREAVLVVLELLHSDVPALYGVTFRAVRAHFSLVHVRVTVLAVLSHLGKDRLDMALRTLHLLMHAAQRVLRLVVVKLWVSANGPP